MATKGHIMLLEYLREVFWQDCVVLQRAFPEFSLFKHNIFNCLEYLSFKEKLEERISTYVDNSSNFSLTDGNDVLNLVRTSHQAQMREVRNIRNDVLDIKEKLCEGSFISLKKDMTVTVSLKRKPKELQEREDTEIQVIVNINC